MLVYYQARLGPIPPAYTQAPGSSQALSPSLSSTLGSSPPDLQNSFSWAFFFFDLAPLSPGVQLMIFGLLGLDLY